MNNPSSAKTNRALPEPLSGADVFPRGGKTRAGGRGHAVAERPVRNSGARNGTGRRCDSTGGASVESPGVCPGEGKNGDGQNDRRPSRRFRERLFRPKNAAARRTRAIEGGHLSAHCFNQDGLHAARRCRGAAGGLAGMQVSGEDQKKTGHPVSCHNVSIQRTSAGRAGLEAVRPNPRRASSFLRGDSFQRHVPHRAFLHGPESRGPAPS